MTIQNIGREIFKRGQGSFRGFGKHAFSDRMMQWAMQHPELKVEMFRFVDVLPILNSRTQIVEHLRQYFIEGDKTVPFFLESGLKLSLSNPITQKITAVAVKKNVSMMASTFITGRNSKEAHTELRNLWNDGFCFTVDILGEAVVSENEARDYQSRYLELVNGLSEKVKTWRAKPILESISTGSLPRANISVKCSSLYSQMSVLAFRNSVDEIKSRLRPILEAAIKNNAFIYLDMEQNDYRDIILTVAEEVFIEKPFRNYPHFGLVLQAYLKSAEADIRRIVNFAKQRGTELTIRLVKGAYWDYENIVASQRDLESPVFATKPETDASYERCTTLLIDACPVVRPAFASHNVRSLSHALAQCEKKGLAKNDFEIQMLYGMAHEFKRAVRDMGFRVRDYAPVGELLPGMAYLVRRLLENTSNEGFLKQSKFDHRDIDVLLADPSKIQKQKPAHIRQSKQPATQTVRSIMLNNQSLIDFTLEENRNWIERYVSDTVKSLPRKIPVVVNGQSVSGLTSATSQNPSDKSIVSQCQLADTATAELAIEACRLARQSWSSETPKFRADVMRRVADVLLMRRKELMTLMVLEVGKSFVEADADVCEAIDFCRYYADCAEMMMRAHPTSDILGEANNYIYEAKGVAVAIAPWNFPLAILCGMTVAPLVCGNAVIMKPAEQSPVIAYELYKVLIECGVPAGVVQFLPGLGEVVGDYLVKHKDVHVISFTGSRDVGLSIIENSAKLAKGQKHIKKVIAELGGKNAVIVDDDADLDEAVIGCLQSAFGFAGQKCSALSRIIVLQPVYDKFKERFVEGLLSLKVGAPVELQNKIGPVIDAESQERLLNVIRKHKKDVLAQIELSPEIMKSGYFVPPTVFATDDLDSDLAQKEFFGPIVTLIQAKSLDHALTIMNGVDYALTGGFFSRSPKNIERVKKDAEVGNLYINRGITGAVVCRQPFGGFKLSGVGGKAGGPDYLLHFLEPRTITENTMRRGFSPDL